MAIAVHERYLEDNATSAPADHPAMVPWDDLDRGRRAQNRDQVRENVERMRAAGYEVIPAEGVAADHIVEHLPDDVVDRLARIEHDRWAEKKRAQGYRFGEQTVDVGDDRRHPNLVSWQDLDEAVRDKDRYPIRDFPRVLRIGGWVLATS